MVLIGAAEALANGVEVLPNGCHRYAGQLDRDGYGRVGPALLAHRLLYQVHVGPIPDGWTLDHLCHTGDVTCPGGTPCPHRACVNPDHLEAVPRGENVRRRTIRQRGRA